jgi:hypothetical protein
MDEAPIGTYTFLPWVREGLANQVGAVTGARSTMDISVQLSGTKVDAPPPAPVTVTKTVQLYGPGDVIGVDAAQISRLEPPNWVTNYEPNYLAAIEFYDEDFPWRYTPAAPSGRRLLPWLALVVLAEDGEFTEGKDMTGRPLPYIRVTADLGTVFPDAGEAWAWAHTHVNDSLSANVVETDSTVVGQAIRHVIDTAPDTACSRLLCPRKLRPKTGYHAFLVPAFESGRLAGLGLDPATPFGDSSNGLTATSSSWGAYAVPANRPDANDFPYYHRWYFRTAESGDFESLVRLLKPRVVDSRVGQRDIDARTPAPNVTGVAEFDGVLRMGGALKAPFATMSGPQQADYTAHDQWATPYPRPFQSQLAAFVNLSDSYQWVGPAANGDANLAENVQADPDPLVTPPLYGRWHALTERLLTDRDGHDAPHRTNWVHDLNLDPRFRVAAGFGTTVVQQQQESLMAGAWAQIGDVLEANRRIRAAQLAKAAGRYLYDAHLKVAAAVSPAALLLKTAPVRSRVLSAGLTVRSALQRSPMSTTLTSAAMRRVLRPGGKLATGLGLAGTQVAADVVVRANTGAISAAPPRPAPTQLLTPDVLAAALAPTPSQAGLVRLGQWLRGHMALSFVLLLVFPLLAVLAFLAGPVGWAVAGALAAALVVVAATVVPRALQAAAQQAAADALSESHETPSTVDGLPGSSGFTLVTAADPRGTIAITTAGAGQTDNATAAAFKTALREQYALVEVSRKAGARPPTTPLALDRVAGDVLAGMHPDLTVPRYTWSGITVPARLRAQMSDDLVPVMAYPEFDQPMYEPLVAMDKAGFVPGLHLVEPDSITLLETNQRFIESYLVGLNHEFARELLWREYPTDQRGSYFRQFWDVRKKVAEATDKAAAREKYRDIKPIHTWPAGSDLGDHDNREEGQQAEEDLVLVIRGELLKKYPNTIISAQPAAWQVGDDAKPDKARPRILDETKGPVLPLYEARVQPDLYFFGFDLTSTVARGDDVVDDKPGWFFRIEEVPGDARFGFDISREPSSIINVWNDLAWDDVAPGIADGQYLSIASIPARSLVEPPTAGPGSEKHPQWESDRYVPLDSQLSAAEFAYISLQAPVLIAVHAAELLPKPESTS